MKLSALLLASAPAAGVWAASSSVVHETHPRREADLNNDLGYDDNFDDDDEDLAAAAERQQPAVLSSSTNLTASSLDSLSGNVVAIGSEGEVIGTSALRRQLQDNPFDKFQPLSCNDGVEAMPCQSFSTAYAGDPLAETVVVPCGKCVVIDEPDGTVLTFSEGLDIQGKLTFLPGRRITVHTPFVYVQGVLHIRDSNEIAPGNEAVRFVFEGTVPHTFVPHANNSLGCDGGTYCENNVKPFLVAGGKLDVEAWPSPTCPSWTRIHDVVYEDYSGTTDFPLPDQPAAAGCPRGLDAIFDGGITQGWRSHLGAVDEILTDPVDGNEYLSVTNRTKEWQGPYLDLSSGRTCVTNNQDYVFRARIRLTNPTGGTTSCSTDGSGCPVFVVRRREDDGDMGISEKVMMLPEDGMKTTDGEWFPLFGRFTLGSSEADPTNVYLSFNIEGPEPGVVIDVDDLYVGLPPEDQYPDPTQPGGVCSELFPADPGADGYSSYDPLGYVLPPRYPWPLYVASGSSRFLRILTEPDGNNYYAITQRKQEYESLAFKIPPGCSKGGARYDISFRMRIHDAQDYNNVRVNFVGSSSETSSKCPDTMGNGRGWVSCTATVVLDQGDENDADLPLYFRINTGFADGTGETDVTIDVDYDDLSVKLVHGAVKTLVVDSGVAGCWGADSQVMITSNTDDYNDEQMATIESVTDRNDGSGLADVRLTSFIERPTTFLDDPNQATEVALMTRNVVFHSEMETANEGAYLQVLHTTGVPQVLTGVEINQFGQKDNGKHAVHLMQLDNVVGSFLSKNLIRDTGKNGLTLQGTHNVTILENVAFDTEGNSFMLRDGKEWENRLEFNLGAKTRNPGGNDATFLIRSVNNYIIGNVAAGARDRGFYLNLESSVRDDFGSKDLPGGNPKPREQPALEIRDNYAHSCDDYGLVASGWRHSGGGVSSGWRIYKNEDQGAYFNGRYYVIKDSYFADNRIKSVDLHYCDSCSLINSDVVGVTERAFDHYRSYKLGGHKCLDSPANNEGYIVGVELKHFTNDKNHISPGMNFTDVRFSRFTEELTHCANPRAIAFENHRRMPHYDMPTQFEGVTNLDSPVPFQADLCSAEAMDVTDVLFTDLDSSLHPSGPGTYSGPSAIVSNHAWMKGFAEGSCTDIDGRCASYCEGLCLRFLNYRVNAYETEDVTVKITDTDTGKSIDLPGNFYYYWSSGLPNQYSNTLSWALRHYYMPLPSSTGGFTAEFYKGGSPYWPSFVEHASQVSEPAPQCGGAAENSVTFIEPPLQAGECDELVKNGDLEIGNYTHWYHSDGGVDISANTGVGGSYSIVSDQRSGFYQGLAFYVDTRCVAAGVGLEYELTAMMKLENADGTPWDCDPDSTADPGGCPRFNAKAKVWDEASNSYTTYYYSNVATVTRPYDQTDGFTLVHGTFVMPQEFADADSVMFYFTRTKSDAKIYLDDVSIHPLAAAERTSTGSVSGELIVNGDMELSSNTQFWDTRREYAGAIAMSTGEGGTGNAIKVTGRTSSSQGPGQYLNPATFVDGQEYQVSANFKLSKNGAHITCDPNQPINDHDDSCPQVTIKTWDGALESPLVHTYTHVGEVADPGSETSWGTLHGTFFPTSEMIDAYRLFVYFRGANDGVDIEIDNVSIMTYSLDCSNVVKNGDFEVGDFRGWSQTTAGGVPSMFTPGASGTSFAMMVSDRTYLNWGMEQELDMDCLESPAQYHVAAKIKLMDGGNPFTCNANVIYGSDGCPVAAISSEQATGTRTRDVAAVVGSADVDGWYDVRGIFELYESDVASNKVKVLFKDAPPTIDLIVDEVVMTKVESPVGFE